MPMPSPSTSIEKTPLLTAHLFAAGGTAEDDQRLQRLIERLAERHIAAKRYEADRPLAESGPRAPRVYASIGEDWREFPALAALPVHEKRRWLHFRTPDEVGPDQLFYCWLKATDPLPENRPIPPSRFASDTPLVSVFTAAYRSEEKIRRPYESLLKQTYANWEWVIVDDSGDGDETYREHLLPLADPRVRRYRQDDRSGYIGAIKRYAAGLCAGEILVEVDHDDELMPDCLAKLVEAFRRHPDCGFAYGDCAEVYDETLRAHWYGWDCGFGYSLHYRVWLRGMNRWQNVQKHSTMNASTLRHLVGLPNHPRAWTRDCYHLAGGHRSELLVADDYDLLVRTFLCTRFVAVPDLLYVQYRNASSGNTTFRRNKQIQALVKELNRTYEPRIAARLRQLGIPERPFPYRRVWQTPADDPARLTAHVADEDGSRPAILFPLPYSEPDTDHPELIRELDKGRRTGYKHAQIVVVGRIPDWLEGCAAQAPTGAVRWWPMEPGDDVETCIRYAAMIASCKEKIVIVP
ncbi:Glycosyltransferase involved in cell wall bisynthesis [Paenibacillus sp. UNC496MF]|nr:Glycosyltransferase involved in cell wall bisynthesis [Paenibacillus sp. UNC496MF]